MSYKTGTAAGMGDLLAQFNAFLTVGHSLDPQYQTAGDGTIENIIGTAASVVETITVTFTGATAFSVSGSDGGSLGSGTAGTAFTSPVCGFTIAAGSVPFVSGDKITFGMTPPWENLRAANVNTGTDEYIWRAPGNDGESEIYVGMLRFANVIGDYDNLRLGGFAGYGQDAAFAAQPQPLTRPVMPGLRVGTIKYWFIANGCRAMMFIKCGDVYEGAYLGFLKSYWKDEQWPYPLVLGGSMSWNSEPAATSTNWRYSYVGSAHNLITFYGDTNTNAADDVYTLRLRRPDGRWRGFGIGATSDNVTYAHVWPFNRGIFTNVRPNLGDNTYPLFPIVLSEDASNGNNPAIYGEMDGLYAVSGYENTSENIVTVNRAKYLVLQNVYRTTFQDYMAIKLV